MNNIDEEKLKSASEDNYVKISFGYKNHRPCFYIIRKYSDNHILRMVVYQISYLIHKFIKSYRDIEELYQDTIIVGRCRDEENEIKDISEDNYMKISFGYENYRPRFDIIYKYPKDDLLNKLYIVINAEIKKTLKEYTKAKELFKGMIILKEFKEHESNLIEIKED